MTYKSLIAISFAAGTFFGTAGFAESHQGHGMGNPPPYMMDMMQDMHSQMHEHMQGQMHDPMHDHMQGQMHDQRHGPMHDRMHDQMHGSDWRDMHSRMPSGDRHHMKGMMGGMMRQMLDANGDGTVTPMEASTQPQALLSKYDTDANGTLSISEYEVLHSAMIREKMVDRFQHLDANGDGQITSGEMNAPAERMKKMMHMQMPMHMQMTPQEPKMQRGMDQMQDMDHGRSTQSN